MSWRRRSRVPMPKAMFDSVEPNLSWWAVDRFIRRRWEDASARCRTNTRLPHEYIMTMIGDRYAAADSGMAEQHGGLPRRWRDMAKSYTTAFGLAWCRDVGGAKVTRVLVGRVSTRGENPKVFVGNEYARDEYVTAGLACLWVSPLLNAVVSYNWPPRVAAERGFVGRLRSVPWDTTAWLVYADWLDEAGGQWDHLTRYSPGYLAPGAATERPASADLAAAIRRFIPAVSLTTTGAMERQDKIDLAADEYDRRQLQGA